MVGACASSTQDSATVEQTRKAPPQLKNGGCRGDKHSDAWHAAHGASVDRAHGIGADAVAEPRDVAIDAGAAVARLVS